ncbi:MAG: phosphoribosylglycinamide formyltransferase [Pseudomonadota bacterium]
MSKLRAAVLISGRGTNMGALARAAMDTDYPVEIVQVLSNKPHVPGLELATKHNIPFRVVDQSEFETREDHEAAMDAALREIKADIVCLAGYMRILGEGFINNWRGQIINIHPSLLPSFRGVDTHERALLQGVRVHGCTVHFVNAELDGGPIIAQATVPVHPSDTPETLSERVLEAEHVLFPHALALIAHKRIRWTGDSAVKDMDVAVDDVLLQMN